MQHLETFEPIISEADTHAITAADLDPNIHPITVCVMFRMRHEPDAKRVASLLTAVRRRVTGLIELHFGKNVAPLSGLPMQPTGGNTHALVARVENSRLLRVTRSSPEYVALMRYLLSLVEREPYTIEFVNVPSRL